MIVNQAQAPLFDYMHERLKTPYSDDFRAIALVSEEHRGEAMQPEHIVACVSYNCFSGRVCQVHSFFAEPRKVTANFIRAVFEYPFEQCGVVAMYAGIESTNERALRLNKHAGFVEMWRVPGGGLTGDLVLMQVRRDECRFLQPRRREALRLAA